jgi:VanZ family protein
MKMIKSNALSILIAVFILFLSFSEDNTFDKANPLHIPYPDKIAHFGMYFVLMISLSFENKVTLKNIKLIYLLAIIPFSFGAIIEILQPRLTATRSGDIIDLCFNVTGILFAILFWIILKHLQNKQIK